jgi:hypothetical protein
VSSLLALVTSESTQSPALQSSSLSNRPLPDADTSVSSDHQYETRIAELLAKQASLQRWLKVFVEESSVRRDTILGRFGRLRAVLESVERAALAAYDDEVRRVVKGCEVEFESLEVLSQQLSARVLALSDTDSDGTDADMATGSDGADKVNDTVRCVDLALCEDDVCEVLRGCWSLVSVDSEDGDEVGLAVAEAHVSLLQQVMSFLSLSIARVSVPVCCHSQMYCVLSGGFLLG